MSSVLSVISSLQSVLCIFSVRKFGCSNDEPDAAHADTSTMPLLKLYLTTCRKMNPPVQNNVGDVRPKG